ncbi:hypothetical protein BC827DRAFT_1340953 [Russula dissimulans]|nr:hypothetical protein BC827DRAFT_1340953 [Russula dissimulans]
MHDGTSLRQAWYNALNDAQTSFRQLLTSSSSPDWRRVPLPRETNSLSSKGKGRSSLPELSDVIVHRRSAKSEDTIYRVVLDVPTADDTIPFDAWKSILATPELRQEWDPAVDGAVLLEMLDPTTRISKTNFTLGWPANPRDAVTISRTFNDATTIIDVSTSLPRSPDEPAYLRPSPPYVRSNVKLFAWCIQSLSSAPSQPQTAGDSSLRKVNPGRLRITCFWQHDLRALWNIGTVSSMAQQLAAMVLGLLKTAIKRRSRVPLATGYGNGVAVSRIRFDLNRESLTLEYSIIPEDEDHPSTHSPDDLQGLDEFHAIREHRRLTRTVEFSIPLKEGWDVQISTQASSDKVAQLPWSARAYRNSAAASISSSGSPTSDSDNLLLRVNHAALLDDHSLLKVQIVIERSASSGLRLNGMPQAVEYIEERNPTSYLMSQQMLQDATSNADVSFLTTSSNATGRSTLSGSSGSRALLQPPRPTVGRTAAQDKSILSRIRRNYIYFSSLLQEPEAKWKRTTEARGVSVTQLDSIDPTLVVYKAEATFVGVGLWDLYAAIASPGARPYWDKQHEDATLLEDINELTELWHFKSRPTWPANPRDSVLLKTVYKSPTTVHVFSFSADEPNLFPNIPQAEANTIRTQVDLQGFAIETLSPTTTLLTLLEQSDPKGWTNKTAIPQQMITTLAGIGEFAIKCGGPPVATRLAGAKATEIRYDHDRALFRIEYEVSTGRRTSTSLENSPANSRSDDGSSSSSMPIVECELRCDMDTWATSLDIVVDPPPQSISCLRRHRLSSGGGGLWLTLTHDAVLAGEERLMSIVRRGPGRERGVVMLNGSKVSVDVEELPEAEIKSLSKQKRVKPRRIPLDQPPVLGVIRRRQRNWDGESEEQQQSSADSPQSPTKGEGASSESRNSTWTAAVPRLRSPLGRYLMQAMEQAANSTQLAVAAISPPSISGDHSAYSPPSEFPMEYALDALGYLQALHSQSGTLSDGWALISEKGFPLHRKVSPEISPNLPVYKGERVIEGISAEEIAAVVMSYDTRKRWDERFVGAHVLEAFAGAGSAHTAFTVSKANFPFRDRGFYLASILARGTGAGATREQRGKEGGTTSDGRSPPLFCVSASFPPELARTFTTTKYNPYSLPIGRMFIDGWILETLDPYTTENYAIPSTRCTRVIAADYAGSLPAAVNAVTNTTLVRTLLSIETYMKGIASLPFARLPAAGVLVVDKRAEEGDPEPAPLAAATPPPGAWTLRRRDESRELVQTRWTPDDRVYRGVMLLTVPAEPPVAPASLPSSSSPISPSASPNPTTKAAAVAAPNAGVGVGVGGGVTVGLSPTPVAAASESSSSDLSASTLTVRPHSRSVSSSTVTPVVRRRVTSAAMVAGGRSPSSERSLRATSSAFTVRGEVRQASDLLVAEVVVDSKLYPEGYHVHLRSWPHEANKPIPLLSAATATAPVPPVAAAATATATTAGDGDDTAPATSATSSAVASEPTEARFLPLTYAVYTLPSSPLHSSGLAVDHPPRHLLRLMLPTAQTQISTLLDPLTGETRAPPPKPRWLVDLCETGAMIEVEIRPATQSLGGGKKTNGGGETVTIDGIVVEVKGEKESLTRLGREELQDDRMGWMAVLSRHSSESEGDRLPTELRNATAVADFLLEPGAIAERRTVAKAEEKEEESMATRDKEGNEDTSSKARACIINPPPQSPDTPTVTTPTVGTNSSGGLLRGFLNGYPNPLFSRFASGSGSRSTSQSCAGRQSGNAASSVREDAKDQNHAAVGAGVTLRDSKETGGSMGMKERRFTLWTVIVIGLISFLIGSLLRSLISPADFIYVVTDLGEVGEMRGGWREVKRLVEVKYIVGGWDFQIAVVRRH